MQPDFYTWLSQNEKPQLKTKNLKGGTVVWENDKIFVAITSNSSNIKTGRMAQLWILGKQESPSDAVKSGKDELVCGKCPLRGKTDGKRAHGRACYVVPFMGPNSVYKSKNKYSGNEKEILKGQSLRLGAYGDPAFIPFDVLNRLVSQVTKHTGYTHQWEKKSKDKYKDFLMASVESKEGKEKANKRGWRTFRIMPKSGELLPDEILCPASKEGGGALTCYQCGLCDGNRNNKKKNIAIYGHGSPVGVGKNIEKLAK